MFPPDVLVGVIKELTPEASGKSTLAVIRPGADPRTVRHVFIITNYTTEVSTQPSETQPSETQPTEATTPIE